MGNSVSFRLSDATGKVILSDGTVHVFNEPLTVAELMLEHPQQVVVEFKSAVTEKRTAPLPADKKLDMDKVYIMVPMKRGNPATLSSEEARRMLYQANSVLKSRSLLSASRFLPLFAKICPGGTKDGHEFVLNRKEIVVERPEEGCQTEFLPKILEGRPEYLSRQFSGKAWKPNLDTIKEKKVEKKVPHWLF